MKLHLKDVRLSFCNVHDAKAVNGQGDPKFSTAAILPRTHPQLAEIVGALKKVATDKWGAKGEEVYTALKAGDKLCLHDGDSKAEIDAYKSNLFINASNKQRPLVIDGQRNPLVAADGKPYSGCYGNVIVEVWAQDNQFGKRINASLLGVQFVKDGERLAGGGVAAADDFEAIPTAETAKAETTGAGAASLF